MSNTLLKIKRSAVKGKSPTTSNVSLGELALNTNDGRLFFKTTDSSGTSAIATLREISGGTGITATNGVLSLDNQVTAQTVGNATTVPRLTINAQGQITGVATATVAGVSGFDFDSSNGTLTITTSAGNFSDVLTLDPYTTTDLTEGTNQYHTTARARQAISATGSLAYNNSTGVVSFTERTDQEVRNLFSSAGDLAYDSSTGQFSFSAAAQAVTSVNSETGAITLTTNDIAEGGGVLYYTTARFDSDFGDNSTSNLSEGTNLYHTTARARNAISATNTGTGYGSLSYTSGTGALSFAKVTNANIRSALSAGTGITYNSSTGQIGTSITQYTDSKADSAARHAISVTDNGGDGSISYDASTGAITYSGISNAQVRGKISAGTGISYNNSTGVITNTITQYTDAMADSSAKNAISGGTGVTYNSTNGQISIGQAVGTTDDVTFNDVTVSGDLTVSGDNTTLNVGTLSVEDKNIVVGNNATSSSVTDGAGITFGAWSSGTIPTLTWNHSDQRLVSNYAIGANLVGNVTGNADTVTNGVYTTGTQEIGGIKSFSSTPVLKGTSASEGGELNFGAPTGGVYSSFAVDNYQGHIRVHTLQSGKNFQLIGAGETNRTTLNTDIGTVWGSANDGASSGLDADLLDGQHGSHYLDYGNFTSTPDITATARGAVSATGDLSYNQSTGEFSFSETYSTAAELLTAIKTVDTNSSGLNADTLDGQEGTHYRINVYNSSGTLLN